MDDTKVSGDATPATPSRQDTSRDLNGTRAKGFQKGHPSYRNLANPDAAKSLLIKKLKDGSLTDTSWWEGLETLARLLYDREFVKAESRKLILPIVDRAIQNGYVSGPTFNKCFKLSRLWHDQPNYIGPADPPAPTQPTAEEVAAKKQADAEAARLREEEHQARIRAEAAEQLRRSAFLDETAKAAYIDARENGKGVIYQLPSGEFVFEDGEPIDKSWVDLFFKYGSPIVVWIKNPPKSKGYVLALSDEDLRWVSTEPEPKPVSVQASAIPDNIPAPTVAPNWYQAHCKTVYDRFARTRKVSFTEVSKDSKGYIQGIVKVESAVFSQEFYNVRSADFKRWEANRFDSTSVPESMRAAFADTLRTAMNVVPARNELDPFTAGIRIKPYGFSQPKVEYSYPISQTGLAAEYERERKRGGFDL